MLEKYHREEGIEIRRVILDTNIYGKLIEEDARTRERIKSRISRSFVVYGTPTIRRELRETPRQIRVENKKLRIALLELYDLLVKHQLDVIKKCRDLAIEYFGEYRKADGLKNWQGMENDFLIVACATVYNLDVIVSEDEASMLSRPALRAYRAVNTRSKFGMPEFLKFGELKKSLFL